MHFHLALIVNLGQRNFAIEQSLANTATIFEGSIGLRALLEISVLVNPENARSGRLNVECSLLVWEYKLRVLDVLDGLLSRKTYYY